MARLEIKKEFQNITKAVVIDGNGYKIDFDFPHHPEALQLYSKSAAIAEMFNVVGEGADKVEAPKAQVEEKPKPKKTRAKKATSKDSK